jgi:hypothetical protein
VAAFTDRLISDTGSGPLWYFAVIAMGFPTGAIFVFVGSLLLSLVELSLLGIDAHFAPIAQVCLAWATAFAGGLAQGALIRRLSRSRASGGIANKTAC